MLPERRKFLRFDVPLNVEFKPLKETGEYFLGITKNFSREGLSVVSQKFDLKPKEKIELKLNLPEKESFITVLGDIIWKKQLDAKCWTGIKLRDMDKDAKSEILDYAYNMWVEKMRR